MCNHHFSNWQTSRPWRFEQRFSPKAPSVLEKKIFKGFYHIWAWRPSWSINRDHFSNISFPQPKEAPHEIWATLARRLQRRSRLKFSTFFPYKWMVPIQMQTWPRRKKVKRQCTTIVLAILVDLSSPDDLCKDSAPRHPRFWRRRFLKVFTIYGHGGHRGQRTATILAIFRSSNLRRLH